MFRTLYNLNNRKKNNLLVNIIRRLSGFSGLSNLKNEIKKMSEDEIKVEKPCKIVDIVEKILEFNEKNPKPTRTSLKNFNTKPNSQ